MSKLSKRLFALVEFVESNDKVVDVGCDHGLLSIYLYENKLCKKVIASDINQNALNNAIDNINLRKLDIETVLSDGIKDVNLKGIDTLIISGMGTSTVLHILEDASKLKNINKIIIQSNNEHGILRQEMNNKGYYLENETIIFERGKWYTTCLFIKNDKKNTSLEVTYGYLNNIDYVKYLISYNKKINKKIPITKIGKKISYWKDIKYLKKKLRMFIEKK